MKIQSKYQLYISIVYLPYIEGLTLLYDFTWLYFRIVWKSQAGSYAAGLTFLQKK